jgi:hypothetical protein
MNAADAMMGVSQRCEQGGNGGETELDAVFLEAVEIGNG